MHKLEGGELVSSLFFHETAFQVQIHGLPTLSQTRKTGLSIGGILGKVKKVDIGDKGLNLGCYLRIRVIMDISQPLIQGRMVHMGGSNSQWVEFKYERLPVFCYLCGRLDHDEKECIDWIRGAVSINLEDKQYGRWLHVNPDRLQKSHMVLGQLTGERARPEQMGAVLTESERQPGKQTAASVLHRQVQGVVETNEDRADMESMVLESEKIKEKLTEEKGKSDFEEQLREIDAEIVGKADMGCNVEKVSKVRKLELEKKMSAPEGR